MASGKLHSKDIADFYQTVKWDFYPLHYTLLFHSLFPGGTIWYYDAGLDHYLTVIRDNDPLPIFFPFKLLLA